MDYPKLMKQEYRSILRVINFVLVGAASVLFCSCSTFLFSRPQPVDAVNIYEFPTKFRGSWIEKSDTITIGNDYFRMTNYQEPTKIVNGIYVNPADAMAIQKGDTAALRKRNKASKYFQSLQSVSYNSLGNPIDTVTNYIIKGNRIYEIGPGGLWQGFPFVLKDDTIYTRKLVPTQFELGRNAFLREVTKDQYIVNISGGIIQDRTHDGWWQLYLLERTSDGKIYVRGIDRKKLGVAEMIYSKEDCYYFDNRWTKGDLRKLIQEGIFERGDPLENKSKVKLK